MSSESFLISDKKLNFLQKILKNNQTSTLLIESGSFDKKNCVYDSDCKVRILDLQ